MNTESFLKSGFFSEIKVEDSQQQDKSMLGDDTLRERTEPAVGKEDSSRKVALELVDEFNSANLVPPIVSTPTFSSAGLSLITPFKRLHSASNPRKAKAVSPEPGLFS